MDQKCVNWLYTVRPEQWRKLAHKQDNPEIKIHWSCWASLWFGKIVNGGVVLGRRCRVYPPPPMWRWIQDIQDTLGMRLHEVWRLSIMEGMTYFFISNIALLFRSFAFRMVTKTPGDLKIFWNIFSVYMILILKKTVESSEYLAHELGYLVRCQTIKVLKWNAYVLSRSYPAYKIEPKGKKSEAFLRPTCKGHSASYGQRIS